MRSHRCGMLIGLLVALTLAAAAGHPAPAAAQGANVVGQWQTRPELMQINPIHVAMLRTGKVLVVAGTENDATVTTRRAALWDPSTGTVTVQSLPWDLFCNAMSLLPDGRALITGGTLQ